MLINLIDLIIFNNNNFFLSFLYQYKCLFQLITIKLCLIIRFFSIDFFAVSLIVIIYIVIKRVRFDNVFESFFRKFSRIFKKKMIKIFKNDVNFDNN